MTTSPAPAAPARRSLSRRAVMFRLVLLGGGLVGGFLFAEIVLRVLGYGLGTASAYQPDPHCGARLRPGFSGWHTTEGRAWVTINSHGFRDLERPVAKRPGTFRIAVLGDSYIEALQLPAEQSFTALLERTLNESCVAESALEVLNFGCSGYGTAQELQLLRHYVWEFDPDFVLLAFLPGNDVRNNSAVLEPSKGRPFFHLRDGQLELDTSFQQAREFAPLEQSAWLRLKHAVITTSRVAALVYQYRHRVRGGATVAPLTIDGFEPGLDAEIYRSPPREDWQHAWEVTERIMAEMHREVTDRGREFAVVLVNNGIDVRPETELRDEFCRQLGVDDLSSPQTRIIRLGEKAGFPVIPLADSMREQAESTGVYFHGFANTRPGTGHWNELGHRAAAEIVARRLCELIRPAKSN